MIPEAPSEESVTEWQLSAARLLGTGGVRILVRSADTKAPLPQIEVEVGGRDPTVPAPEKVHTTDAGVAWLTGLLPGKHYISMSAVGYRSQITVIHVQAGSYTSRRVLLEAGKEPETIVDEFEGAVIGSINHGWRIRSRRVDVQDLPVRPPSAIIALDGEEATLCSLWRRRVNREVFSYTFIIPASDLPPAAKVYDVILPREDGKYDSYKGSSADYRREMELQRVPRS